MKFIDSSAKTNWKFIAIVVIVVSLVIPILLYVGLLADKGVLIPRSRIVPPIIQQVGNNEGQQKPQEQNLQYWQTYRNDEFGFEVKYPRDWSIIGETTNQPAFSPDGKVKIYIVLHVSGTPDYIYSLAYKDEQECPEQIFKPGEPAIGPGAACPVVKPKETKKININGINGYLKERESGSLSAYLPRSDKKIAIELTTRHVEYKDIFNQILSTFRFVK